jgi:CheY-like chemotaxis protein
MSKILLVEDDALLAKLMVHRLQKEDFEVVTAINGLEAINKAANERPDLILMDIRLPLLDGWEATKQIRAMPQTADTPIIALTAQASALDEQRSLAVGCNEYVAKPVQFSTLLDLIGTLLNKVGQDN